MRHAEKVKPPSLFSANLFADYDETKICPLATLQTVREEGPGKVDQAVLARTWIADAGGGRRTFPSQNSPESLRTGISTRNSQPSTSRMKALSSRIKISASAA